MRHSAQSDGARDDSVMGLSSLEAAACRISDMGDSCVSRDVEKSGSELPEAQSEERQGCDVVLAEDDGQGRSSNVCNSEVLAEVGDSDTSLTSAAASKSATDVGTSVARPSYSI